MQETKSIANLEKYILWLKPLQPISYSELFNVSTAMTITSSSKPTDATKYKVIIIDAPKLFQHLFRLDMPNCGDFKSLLKKRQRRINRTPRPNSSTKLVILTMRTTVISSCVRL